MKLAERLDTYLSRLRKSHPMDLTLNFHDLMFFINKSPEIKGILNELLHKAQFAQKIDDELIEKWVKMPKNYCFTFDLYRSTYYLQLAFKYKILKKTFEINQSFLHLSLNTKFEYRDPNLSEIETSIQFLIEPVINYITNKLNSHSSVISLLTKYKKRKEWFYRKSFFEEFVKNGRKEDFLDMDLRCFLFENGINYPFSGINSPNGRPDIIADIEKEDAIVLEVKFLDETKNYGNDKIISGFSQSVKYSNDFQKPFGYVVVFNTNPKDIEISIEGVKTYPNEYEFMGKKYFIFTININPNGKSASKIGQTNFLNIDASELLDEIKKN